MSFIGNIVAAQSAKAMAGYNSSVMMAQSKIDAKKAEVREKIYQNIERPELVMTLDSAYSDFKSAAFASGAEFRAGETTGLVAIRNKQKIINEIAKADYNSEVAVNDLKNQSILLSAKAEGERFKGDLTARTQYAQAIGSLLTMGSESYHAKRLVIS